MARVKLIQNKEDVAPEHYELFAELAALRGRISGPSTVILHSPGLARPWNEISEYLHRDSIVEARLAELAVAATAREYDSAYVWNAHAGAARRAGAAGASLDAVAHRTTLDGLPEDEATVIRFVRGLLQNNRVDQDVFDALLAAHDARWLVELACWVGRYGALAGVLSTFEVDLNPNAEPLPVSRGARGAARPVLDTPRLPLITSGDGLDDEGRAVYDIIDKARKGVRGPSTILLYSPPLTLRDFEVNSFFQSTSALESATRELVILATAREKDCPYIWWRHTADARDAGLDDDSIAVVRERGDAHNLAPPQADVLTFVRAVLRDHAVPQDLFDRLRDAHGVTWLVELTALIGHYGVRAAVLNTFEVAPAPGDETLPLP
jgi:4-carboxymuconolactone decarboxylase